MSDQQQTSGAASTSLPLHPLDPLTADEITTAVQIIRARQKLGDQMRFVSVNLHEPEKKAVLSYKTGMNNDRQAFSVLLDKKTGATYEAIVSITEQSLVSWKQLPGAHAPLIFDELAECEVLIKNNEEFRAALRRRGITDMDQIVLDIWTAGDYESEEIQQHRILRSYACLKPAGEINFRAHPIDGIIVLVDLQEQRIIRIDEYEPVPIPSESGSYLPEDHQPLRADLRTIEITQPDGPSFTVNGHEVSWQKWNLRVGFNSREGLVIHTVSYEDQGRRRPILYRASLAEMVVPYGDPSINQYRKNAFDVGEYGIGALANALELGCDCLGKIHYFDTWMADSQGNPVRQPNAICMHEEDNGILWKHYDWRTKTTEVRRSRRLVISFIATVDNYEYGFYWYFYQDGNIEFETRLTGILSTGAIAPGQQPRYGQLVAPQLQAPIHQHIFSMRLDMMVDGQQNSVYEVHAETVPEGPDNPYGNACLSASTLLKTESEAQQTVDPLTSRYWKIVNPHSINRLGNAVGYKLIPGGNTLPFARSSSNIMKRAGFAQKHLWVTQYHPDERYPAGDYPNQNTGGAGLPAWTEANRSIEDTDIVIWYNMILHHVPCPEEWPVMPVHNLNFTLKPVGFFERNPAIDLPAHPASHHDQCNHRDHADHHDHTSCQSHTDHHH